MSLYRWTAYTVWGVSGVASVILLAEELPAPGLAVAAAGALTGIFFLALHDIVMNLGGRQTTTRRVEPSLPKEESTSSVYIPSRSAETERLQRELADLKSRA